MKKTGLLLLLLCNIFVYAGDSGTFEYTIKKDDSLLVLCELFQVSQEELVRINGKEKIDRFWLGDTLKVPLKDLKIQSYTIRKGDTLFDLVKRTGADIERIYALNDSATLERLWAGETIRLPIPYKVSPQKGAEEKESSAPKNFIEYTVQKGDSFYSLSKKFNLPKEALQAAYPRNTLYAGIVIKIPVEPLQKFQISEPLREKRSSSKLSLPGLHYEVEKDSGLRSPMEGEVIGVRQLKGFGRAVFIRHKEWISILASKGYENILVSYGYKLQRDQTLGTVRKGYYVHFFLLKGSEFIAPENLLKGN